MSSGTIKNPNTPELWDKFIKEKSKDLFLSPIYIHKNKLVIKCISNLSGNILDVGVGYGYIEKIILERHLPLKLYGIDISPLSINNLNSNYGKGFKIGNVLDIPFKTNFFDCVLLLDVIEHLTAEDGSIAYKEIKRVLKKNGYLILSVPINENNRDTVNNRHLRKYDQRSITKEIESNGFTITDQIDLYAFSHNYLIKTFFVKIFSGIFKIKPNLSIIKAKLI